MQIDTEMISMNDNGTFSFVPVVLKLTLIVVAVVVAVFCRDRIYALQRQKENLEKQVDLANKALAESVAKPKK